MLSIQSMIRLCHMRVCVVLLALLLNASAGASETPEAQILHAKVGVQVVSAERVFHARPREMLRADDRIRLYIQTEQSCDVYVVHSDQHVASLWLANMRTVPKEQKTVLDFFFIVYQNSPL